MMLSIHYQSFRVARNCYKKGEHKKLNPHLIILSVIVMHLSIRWISEIGMRVKLAIFFL